MDSKTANEDGMDRPQVDLKPQLKPQITKAKHATKANSQGPLKEGDLCKTQMNMCSVGPSVWRDNTCIFMGYGHWSNLCGQRSCKVKVQRDLTNRLEFVLFLGRCYCISEGRILVVGLVPLGTHLLHTMHVFG